jgi:multidrug resistance efflux pump
LRREIAMLEGEMVSIQAVIARLEEEVEQHRIRAPVAGEIGEVAPLKAGGVVNAGEVLATLIPAGELRLVADFDPATVLGRVQPGQVGELRLDAFAWTQYGVIRARVVGVGREIRNGRVRVDLLPDVAGHANIPLQHGLPGTVEIAIERTTPALLVLRAAGRMLARPAATDPQGGAGDAAAPAAGPQG